MCIYLAMGGTEAMKLIWLLLILLACLRMVPAAVDLKRHGLLQQGHQAIRGHRGRARKRPRFRLHQTAPRPHGNVVGNREGATGGGDDDREDVALVQHVM